MSRKNKTPKRNQLIQFWNQYNDKIIFILFLMQATLGYKLIQKYFPVGRVLKISFIDDNIPLISIFVVAYMCYSVLLWVPFIITFHNKKQFLAISTAFLFVVTISNILFIFFQTTIIRPEIIPNNIFDRLVTYIYSVDKPVNLFPSLHVAFPVLTTLCLKDIKKKFLYILAPITVLIILSTLFIKQHHCVDAIAGLVIAFIGYRFIFKKIMNAKDDKKQLVQKD